MHLFHLKKTSRSRMPGRTVFDGAERDLSVAAAGFGYAEAELVQLDERNDRLWVQKRYSAGMKSAIARAGTKYLATS